MNDDQKNDRFDRYGALYLLCTRYHRGQWSRGYRILSRLHIAGYRPGLAIQNGKFESEEQKEYYKRWKKLKHSL